MSIRGWKLLAMILAATSFVLIICCAQLFVQNYFHRLHANFANETTTIIQDMRIEALVTNDPHRAAVVGHARDARGQRAAHRDEQALAAQRRLDGGDRHVVMRAGDRGATG